MKRKKTVFKILVFSLTAVVAVVLAFRICSVINESQCFRIRDFSEVSLKSLHNRAVNLADLTGNKEPVFFLIFNLNSCYSCIAKGIEDLRELSREGFCCFAVAVHNSLGELKGWCEQEKFKPFFFLGKKDFYRSVTCSMLPVLVKARKNRVRGFRFITP